MLPLAPQQMFITCLLWCTGQRTEVECPFIDPPIQRPWHVSQVLSPDQFTLSQLKIFLNKFSMCQYLHVLNDNICPTLQLIWKYEWVSVQWLSPVRLFATPWTAAHQAPLSKGFPRQEYWGGLPFPSPGDLPDPGIELASPALAGRFLTTEPPGKPIWEYSRS